jgi:hypothetical protein
LLEFARQVARSPARILIFLDADTDRLHGVKPPDNVTFTDGRDVESYVLTRECLDKVLRVGLGTEAVNSSTLYEQLREAATIAGAIRLASELDGMALPFQRTNIARYAESDKGGEVELDISAYVQTLLQNGGISLTRQAAFMARVSEVRSAYKNAIGDLIHGKDAMRLLDAMLKRFSVRPDDARRLLWCSFDRTTISRHPNLSRVLAFLTSA